MIQIFLEELYVKPIPITCFDTNSNGRIICAGSERVITHAFLVFFDPSQGKKLGGYSISYEDITNIRVHSINLDSLISNLMVGLAHISDMSKENEDDTLRNIMINTGSSVHKLHYLENSRRSR